MILLMSEYRDISTHKVIDWLKLYQVEYELIYKESYIDSIFFCSNELEYRFVCESKKINLTKVQFFWYRRGDINFTTNVRSIENTAIKNSISLNCNEEITVLSNFFTNFYVPNPISAPSPKSKKVINYVTYYLPKKLDWKFQILRYCLVKLSSNFSKVKILLRNV
jgi:hypothetical protein